LLAFDLCLHREIRVARMVRSRMAKNRRNYTPVNNTFLGDAWT